MFIELFDVIPMLGSIGIILTVLCSVSLIRTSRRQLAKSVSFTKSYGMRKTVYIPYLNTLKVKRREGPEDDSDHTPLVSDIKVHEKRGGKSCRKHLYSLPFKNMALF
ncbi:MAG: hypothetical protein WB502_13050 [Thermoactinomyces sp.]